MNDVGCRIYHVVCYPFVGLIQGSVLISYWVSILVSPNYNICICTTWKNKTAFLKIISMT